MWRQCSEGSEIVKMGKVIILVFSIFLILFIMSWLYNHPICLVCGLSMYPTFDDGSIILSERVKDVDVVIGEVYIFKRPTEDGKTLRVIKRVHDVLPQSDGLYCYILGDNPPMSYDSRDYGYIKCDEVVAKVTKILRY